MPRLIAALLFALAFALVVTWCLRRLRDGLVWLGDRPGDRRGESAPSSLPIPKERPMQRLSFVLLCALVLYASVWGG